MFCARYFARRYFAARYWPKVGASLTVSPVIFLNSNVYIGPQAPVPLSR